MRLERKKRREGEKEKERKLRENFSNVSAFIQAQESH